MPVKATSDMGVLGARVYTQVKQAIDAASQAGWQLAMVAPNFVDKSRPMVRVDVPADGNLVIGVACPKNLYTGVTAPYKMYFCAADKHTTVVSLSTTQVLDLLDVFQQLASNIAINLPTEGNA